MLRAASAIMLAPAAQENYSKPVLIALPTRAASASRAQARMHQARRHAGKEWGEEARAICVPVGPGGYGGTARSRPPRGQTAGTLAYGDAAGRQRPCTSKQYDAPQDYAGRAFEGVTRGGLGGGLGIFPGKRDAHASHNDSNPPSRHPSRALGKTALTRSQSAAPPANGRSIYDHKMRTSVSGSLAPRPARTMPCSSCGTGSAGGGAGGAGGVLSRSGSSLLGLQRPSSGPGRASVPSTMRAVAAPQCGGEREQYLPGAVPLRGGCAAADKERAQGGGARPDPARCDRVATELAREASAGVGVGGPLQGARAGAARGASPEASPFKKTGGSPFGTAPLRRSQSPLYAAPPVPPVTPRAAAVVPVGPPAAEASERGPVASAATDGGGGDFTKCHGTI